MVTSSPIMRLLVSPLVMGRRSPSSSPALPPRSVERSLSPAPSPPPSTSHGEGSNSVRSEPRKLKSDIWKDMEPIYHGLKVAQGRCKHCNEVFSAARNSGNSHMLRHLSVCEPRLKIHDKVDKLQSSVLSTESGVLTNWKFDRCITRCELVRLIVLHELPFSFVEYDGFRSYSTSLNPLAELVSSTTIRENCIEAYMNHRLTLREILGECKCRFSLTTDLWTSNQITGYICITCHYIDENWKVQEKIIRFCVIKTPHDASNIYSVMLKTIRFYNIEDKLLALHWIMQALHTWTSYQSPLQIAMWRSFNFDKCLDNPVDASEHWYCHEAHGYVWKKVLLLATIPVLIVALIILVLVNILNVGTMLLPVMLNAIGLAGVFGIYAVVCILALVFVFMKVPETKGMTLEVITEFFSVGAKQAKEARD